MDSRLFLYQRLKQILVEARQQITHAEEGEEGGEEAQNGQEPRDLFRLLGDETGVEVDGVDQVCINWGKPSEEALPAMSLDEVERYCAQGQFAPGSMLPKVEAARHFVRQNPDKATIITSLEKLPQALCGKSGTRVYARY